MSHEKNVEFQDNGWTYTPIGKNIWKITRTVAPHAITMTGLDVVTQLRLPFPHRWLRIHWYHTNAALAVSIARLRLTIRRELGTMFPANFLDDLFCEFDITSVIGIEKFGEGFEYEASIWNLILNSTDTDLIFPVFYIQKLET